MDDTEVNIKRHKRKLEKIRNDRQDREQPRDNSTSSERYIQTATGQNERDPWSAEADAGRVYQGERGMDIIPSAIGRSDSSVRSTESENEHAVTGFDRGIEPSRANTLRVEDAESKAERERELTRQRVQRYRDKQKEEGGSQAQNRYSDATPITPSGNAFGNAFSFNLKKGNAEPVKLLSKSEAEDAREALIFVYAKGSSLIDDAIEIVTVGHEPVSIWALSEDEATMFAELHLKKAQKDTASARSARVLLRIHDKLFFSQYIATRTIATGRHIKTAGGISFK